MRPVKNTPIEQDPDKLEGQTQQFETNPEMPNDQQRVTPQPIPAPLGNLAPLEQAQQASQVPEVSKTDEIIKRMYAVREPAPTLDSEKQARLQRMGKINAIGRGVSLMSDVLSLGLGGKVKRRAPDSMAPALYNSYQNLLDKQKNDQSSWSFRDVANQRNNLRTELEVQYKKDTDQLNRDKMVLSEKIRQAKDATEAARYQQKYDQTERQIKQREQQHAEDMRLRYPPGGRAGANKAGKPISIMTPSGKKYQLPPEELSYLTNEAVGNETITSDPKYSQWFNKTETTKQVPNTKWGGFDKVPSGEYTYKLKPLADKHALAQSMLDLWEQGKISLPGRQDQPRNENGSTVPSWTPPKPGTVTGPQVGSHAQQQPAPTKKIDWSTKGKSTARTSTNKVVPSFFQDNGSTTKKQTGGLY